jgi:hypothetical protein
VQGQSGEWSWLGLTRLKRTGEDRKYIEKLVLGKNALFKREALRRRHDRMKYLGYPYPTRKRAWELRCSGVPRLLPAASEQIPAHRAHQLFV